LAPKSAKFREKFELIACQGLLLFKSVQRLDSIIFMTKTALLEGEK